MWKFLAPKHDVRISNENQCAIRSMDNVCFITKVFLFSCSTNHLVERLWLSLPREALHAINTFRPVCFNAWKFEINRKKISLPSPASDLQLVQIGATPHKARLQDLSFHRSSLVVFFAGTDKVVFFFTLRSYDSA